MECKDIRQTYNIGVSTLETIIRQAENNPIIENAWNIRSGIHDPRQILKRQTVKNKIGEVEFISQQQEQDFFNKTVLPLYKTTSYKRDIDYVKVIAWKNETVNKYNAQIREYLFGIDLPKIIIGDKLIADAPVMEKTRTLINTNEEMEVLDVKVETEELAEDVYMKYYKTYVQVLKGGIFNEYRDIFPGIHRL